MKLATLMTVAAASLSLTACATMPAFQPTTTFDPAAVAWFTQPGSNTLKGSALLRQQGGGVVTCAGTKVELLPADDYATERFTYTYGARDGGYNYGLFGRNAGASDPRYGAGNLVKTTTCDPQGFFTFSNLPDGEYYVWTSVQWTVGYSSQGGYLAKRVTLKGGQLVEVVLTA